MPGARRLAWYQRQARPPSDRLHEQFLHRLWVTASPQIGRLRSAGAPPYKDLAPTPMMRPATHARPPLHLAWVPPHETTTDHAARRSWPLHRLLPEYVSGTLCVESRSRSDCYAPRRSGPLRADEPEK